MFKFNGLLDEVEKPKITKDTATLIDNYYNNPSTSLLIFHFEPQLFHSSHARLKSCSIKHISVEGKSLYVFDNFFMKTEAEEMRNIANSSTFSRNSYGSPEAIKEGEQPAGSMNGKERWQFFANPPLAITEIYKLLGNIAYQLKVDITTLPWELCDRLSHGSPAIIANRLTELSQESMRLGKHQDYNPEKGITFGIPVLYSEGREFHAHQFTNGAPGKPWLVSVMVYVTAEEFLPEYRMGTAFYGNDEKIALRVSCSNMRFIFFEGDIFHSMEESNIPDGVKTWRVSYVFKLIMNPREKNQMIKDEFFAFMSSFSPLREQV